MIFKRPVLCFFVASAIILAGCQRQVHENAGDTVLKGNIKFASHGSLYLLGYSDSIDKFLGRKTVLDSDRIENNGDYRFVFHPKSPNIYDLKSADSLLLSSIYISPFNKLTISFGDKYSDPIIDTSKMEGKYNDYREKLIQKFYKDNAVKQFYYIGANYLTLTQFDSFVLARKEQMHAFFENYFKGQKLDPGFEKYALAEINYQYGIDKLMFLWKHRIKNKDVTVDSTYYKDISGKAYLENPDAMGSPAYYHYLNLYINNMYGEMLVKKQDDHIKEKRANPVVEKYNLACQNISWEYNLIVIFNIIRDDMTSSEYNAALRNTPSSKEGAMLKWFHKKYPDIDKEASSGID